MSEFHKGPEDLPTFAEATSAGGSSPTPTPPSPGSIGKVGRYKLTRLIGEGGMGSVYEAEQDQPRRTVALKVIKPGMASPEMLRRFAQESQALGRLQHPGIAQIYDAGTADTGYGPQPYFAMEFIRGEELREYAERQRLTTNQRLEIMVRICDAVQHAHQRGLIHRDLKPVNILVDKDGQPKILDFGVARVTDSDAQATMQTDVGQLVGTLAYMSPEQVNADPLELDTRSDVYALGVILYELLAGRLPYNLSKKLHEALHAIREEDPSKLSSINRSYRGDIETIAAKALEKDKARRYSSAAELAADIMRYLKDEPIVAQPPSTTYQLRKFGRRHRGLVLGLAAVFVVLLLGAVVSAWLAIRATQAEAVARSEQQRATTAEKAATSARDDALDAKGKAEAAEGVARVEKDKALAEKERADTESATAKAVTEFLQKNLFEQVTGGTERTSTPDLSVSGALDRAAAKIDGAFEKQPLVEAGVREAVANAYLGLSLFDKAAPQVEQALQLRRRAQAEDDTDVLKTGELLGSIYANQKRFGESTAILSKVWDIHKRRFGPQHVDTLRYAFTLAAVYKLEEKFDKATPIAVEVAEARRRTLGPDHKDSIRAALVLGDLYDKLKEPARAMMWATRAYESAQRTLGDQDSMTLSAKFVHQGLVIKANAATNTPQNPNARNELLANAARAIDNRTATSLPEMISLASQRATIAVNQNRPQDAEAPLVEALEAARRAGQEEPTLTAILAGVYALQKKLAQAESTIQPILTKPNLWKDLGPNVVPFAFRSMGSAYRNEGRFVEAINYLSKLVPLVRANPGEGTQQTRVDMFLLADTYGSSQKYSEAKLAFAELLEAQRRYSTPEAINTVATISNIGWVELRQGRYGEAERTLREASRILVRTAPAGWERFNVDSMLGAALAAQRKFEEAEPLLVSGYEGMGPLKPVTQATMNSRFSLEQAGDAILQLYKDWGKPEKHAEWTRRLQAPGAPSSRNQQQ